MSWPWANSGSALTHSDEEQLAGVGAHELPDRTRPRGRLLTEREDAETAAAALRRDEAPVNDRERVLATWARAVADHPNDTRPEDVELLRTVGFDDPQILALTLYAAIRMALSTTNDALGARPDQALIDMLDPSVRNAITWGRRPPA
jgi:hypothetical protein